MALRLIVDRDREIKAFEKKEYWTIDAHLAPAKPPAFDARFIGRGEEKTEVPNEEESKKILAELEKAAWSVRNIEKKERRRSPAPPFTTSKLQQDASRKLRFSVKRAMMIAQRLYEGVDLGGETVGLITYMRTDGVAISSEAIAAARHLIGGEFGSRYLPDAPRVYRSPAKNAQEAHEAIRPTDLDRKPTDVVRYLDQDQRRLYELIWKRTIASQMASALLEQVAVDIADATGRFRLRANGSVIRRATRSPA